MTLGVGNVLAKVNEDGTPVTGEVARKFKVTWISGYGSPVLVMLEQVE
jgi:NifB/MoaA-like Fe-S oxidoreductase